MSQAIMDTLKPQVDYKKNEVWTSEWAQVFLFTPLQPTTDRPPPPPPLCPLIIPVTQDQGPLGTALWT